MYHNLITIFEINVSTFLDPNIALSITGAKLVEQKQKKIIRFIEPRSGVQYNLYLPEYLAKPYKSPPYMCTYTHPPQIMGQDYLMNKSRD